MFRGLGFRGLGFRGFGGLGLGGLGVRVRMKKALYIYIYIYIYIFFFEIYLCNYFRLCIYLCILFYVFHYPFIYLSIYVFMITSCLGVRGLGFRAQSLRSLVTIRFRVVQSSGFRDSLLFCLLLTGRRIRVSDPFEGLLLAVLLGFRFRVQWLREFLHFARFCNIPSLLGAFWVPAGVPARVTGVWLGGRGLGFRVQGFEFSA